MTNAAVVVEVVVQGKDNPSSLSLVDDPLFLHHLDLDLDLYFPNEHFLVLLDLSYLSLRSRHQGRDNDVDE
jgi:hypothetical protein